MDQTPQDYVSIVGNSWLHPITDLTEKLFSLGPLKQNDVQVNSFENGYSAALCILSVILFESYVMRVYYLNQKKIEREGNKLKHAVKIVASIYPDFSDFNDLYEIYVLRDLIIHNHIWMSEFIWDDTSGMRLLKTEKSGFSGDPKYEDHVDQNARKTKSLRLNVVPTRVCRTDYQAVLKTVWKALEFIEKKNPNHISVTGNYVQFKGESIPLKDFVCLVFKYENNSQNQA